MLNRRIRPGQALLALAAKEVGVSRGIHTRRGASRAISTSIVAAHDAGPGRSVASRPMRARGDSTRTRVPRKIGPGRWRADDGRRSHRVGHGDVFAFGEGCAAVASVRCAESGERARADQVDRGEFQEGRRGGGGGRYDHDGGINHHGNQLRAERSAARWRWWWDWWIAKKAEGKTLKRSGRRYSRYLQRPNCWGAGKGSRKVTEGRVGVFVA